MNEQICLYARVSSDKQAETGTIKSQIASLQEVARERGFDVDEDMIFVDNGVSGSTLSRPGLDALRDKAASGEVDKVLVLCPDRLARKHVHQLLLIEEFQRLGVEVLFANHSITNTPEDQLLLQVQGVIAEYEREKIMERSRRGKLHKARNGQVSVLVNAPYGYQYICCQKGSDAHYVVVLEEARIVQRIYQMCVYDHMSTKKIALQLSSEGIPTKKRAKHWDTSTIYAILKNPAYMGKAAYGRRQSTPRTRLIKTTRINGGYSKHTKSSMRLKPPEEWITISVPKIIDEQLFLSAQEQLKKNQLLAIRNTKHPYLLQGLIFCKECGHSLGGRTWSTNPHNHQRYKCLGSDRHRIMNGPICSSRAIRTEVLDDLVWEQTKKLLQQPELIFKEYTERAQEKGNNKISLEMILNKKKKELRQLDTQKGRLLSLYQTGTIALSDIETQLSELRRKKKHLQHEYELLEQEQHRELHQLQALDNFNTFRKKFEDNLHQLPFDKKRSLLKLLIREVVVDSQAHSISIQHIIPTNENCRLHLQRRFA